MSHNTRISVKASTAARLCLVLLFGFIDFALLPTCANIDGPNLSGFIFYSGYLGIAAQIGVMSGWLAWSEGPFWRRLIEYWITLFGLWAAHIVGILLAINIQREPRLPDLDLGPLLVALPIVTLIVQVPFWGMRFLLNWRFTHSDCPPRLTTPRQLSIADILLGTLVLALALGCARAWPAVMPEWYDEGLGPGILRAVITIGVGIAITANFVCVPAFALLVLLPKRNRTSTLLGASCAVALPLLAAGILTYLATSEAEYKEMLAASICIFAFTGTMWLSFVVLREFGYRLRVLRQASQFEPQVIAIPTKSERT
jgi:hypothetical protein